MPGGPTTIAARRSPARARANALASRSSSSSRPTTSGAVELALGVKGVVSSLAFVPTRRGISFSRRYPRRWSVSMKRGSFASSSSARRSSRTHTLSTPSVTTVSFHSASSSSSFVTRRPRPVGEVAQQRKCLGSHRDAVRAAPKTFVDRVQGDIDGGVDHELHLRRGILTAFSPRASDSPSDSGESLPSASRRRREPFPGSRTAEEVMKLDNRIWMTAGGPAACVLLLVSVMSACGGGGGGGENNAAALGTLDRASRSSSIALTTDDRRLVVVNRETNSVTVLQVKDGNNQDVTVKLAEIPVDPEPRYVAISPDNRRAFVSSSQTGTVSVIRLTQPDIYTVEHEIQVGTEPRGLAIAPNGTRLYVANHTQGTVSVIDTASLSVVAEIEVGGNPTAIAVSNDGDKVDNDETVFVTRFYAEVIPGGPGEAFDDGKQGVIAAFPTSGGAVQEITLSPLADSGFTADRRPFCPLITASAHNSTFCPDATITDGNNATINADPQAVYPNQLQSLVLRNGLLYAPNIGAQPEPPVKFNVNVQALVSVADATTLEERTDLHVNLNAQIKAEVQPANPVGSLVRVFGNDLVAIDADKSGDRFLIVSRGGNFVFDSTLDAAGRLTIGAPNVTRYQTGNLPSGIVVSADGRRAYVDNEVNVSVTVIDLVNRTVLERDVPSGAPPVPGSFSHGVLVGKLAFMTALGIPDNGVFATPVRDIDPVQNRNKASDNGWSSCSSCHPDGLADGVTWIFGTGPRQTLPLDAFFSKLNPGDQRISNWSGVMGSITDFNNNARGVQGGKGFAGDPPPTGIFQHGITQGGSDALDAMTLWVQTVRAPILPGPKNQNLFITGESVFASNCASCHGGNKWSKSQVVYDNNPTFSADVGQGGVALDNGVTNAGPQIVSFTEGGNTLRFLEGVGTFNGKRSARDSRTAADRGAGVARVARIQRAVAARRALPRTVSARRQGRDVR
jgi:YVTN family beta-propeller protein